MVVGVVLLIWYGWIRVCFGCKLDGEMMDVKMVIVFWFMLLVFSDYEGNFFFVKYGDVVNWVIFM